MIKSFKHKGLEKFFYAGTIRGIQAKHAEKISDILPRRILGWVIIRVWAIATTERYTNKAPYEVDWEMAIKAILGKNGGYLLAPAHNIQPGTPIGNILAFFEAAKEI